MENPIKALRRYITRYVNLRMEEFRLEALKRVVNITGYFVFGIIIFFLAIIMLAFAAFGLAEYLGDVFNSRFAGYFAVSGVFLIFILILLALKRKIFNLVGGKLLWMLTQPRKPRADEDEDEFND